MMKKVALLTVIMLITMTTVVFALGIKLKINGITVEIEKDIIYQNDTVYVPDEVLKSLGYNTTYDPANERYTVDTPQSIDVPTNLKLFLLVGQSNMSGRSAVITDDLVSENIYVFNNAYRWEYLTTRVDDPTMQVDRVSKDLNAGYGLSIAFAQRLYNNYGFDVGLIPCAAGGTSIDMWQRNMSDNSLYGSMIKRARAASQMGTISGILFYQGESDAVTGAPYPELWAQKFTQFVTDVRNDLAILDLPVIYFQLATVSKPGYDNWDLIKQQQQSVQSSGFYRSRIIPNPGYTFDGIHLDQYSYDLLGRGAADIYKTKYAQ